MQGLILAAGRGDRMRPLSDLVPKPLLPIDGVPTVVHCLRALVAVGCRDIVIVVGYQAEVIQRHLGDGSVFGASLSYVHQDKQLGTADAVSRALPAIDEDFVVSAADMAVPAGELQRVVDRFRDPDVDAAVAVRSVVSEEARERSTCIVRDGWLERVIEKPEPHEELSNLTVCPVYVFGRTIRSHVNRVRPTSRGMRQLADAIQSFIDGGARVAAVEVKSIRDITRPDDVLRHNFPYLADYLR